MLFKLLFLDNYTTTYVIVALQINKKLGEVLVYFLILFTDTRKTLKHKPSLHHIPSVYSRNPQSPPSLRLTVATEYILRLVITLISSVIPFYFLSVTLLQLITLTSSNGFLFI
jgi:hypothetical protein